MVDALGLHIRSFGSTFSLPSLLSLPPLSPSLPQGLEDTPLLQFFSCSENHLPKVEGMNHTPLLQHLCLSQNNLQEVAEHFTFLTNYTLHIWLAHRSPPSLPPSLPPSTLTHACSHRSPPSHLMFFSVSCDWTRTVYPLCPPLLQPGYLSSRHSHLPTTGKRLTP